MRPLTAATGAGWLLSPGTGGRCCAMSGWQTKSAETTAAWRRLAQCDCTLCCESEAEQANDVGEPAEAA